MRLGNSDTANQIWDDIQDGIVRSLSVGYRILKERWEGETLFATRWMPFEVSVVAAPADPNAGFYRKLGNHMNNVNVKKT